MVDLKVSLCGVELRNPVVPASGVYGFGGEYRDFYDPSILGGIALKGVTREPRKGNEGVRVAESASGMLNAIGLQNPGIDAFLADELPRLRSFYSGAVIANISGFSVEEYAHCCGKVDGLIDIIEVNISCPNIHGGGMAFGSDPVLAAEVTRAVKAVCAKTPVFVKLSPNVTSIADIARSVREAGADGLSLINTLLAMRIDIKTRRPLLGNVTGGLSGPAIFPVALCCVYEAARAVELPIMGIGGVASAADVLEMMMAGASAVQVGAENLRNPTVCAEILDELPLLCERLGIDRVADIVGTAL